MTLPTPSIQYFLLCPTLIVFGVAVVGVLAEAFLPRRIRYMGQVTLSLAGLIAAFDPVGAYNTHMGRNRLLRVALIALLVAAGAVAADAQRRGRGRFFEPIRSPGPNTFDGAFNFCRIMFSAGYDGDGGNWSVDYLKKELSNAKMELVDTIADTVRLVAQGRADAIVENIDFFMKHTKNYPDVKWKVLPNPIDIGWDAIGVQRGNYPLRDFLNVVLYNLHTSNFVNETWEKWYGAPMLVKVVPNPYF